MGLEIHRNWIEIGSKFERNRTLSILGRLPSGGLSLQNFLGDTLDAFQDAFEVDRARANFGGL